MLSALRSLLKIEIQQENASAEADQAARLACAALLARAAWLDGSLDKSEEIALIDLIMRRFCLNKDEASKLLREAAEDLETSNDIYRDVIGHLPGKYAAFLAIFRFICYVCYEWYY